MLVVFLPRLFGLHQLTAPIIITGLVVGTVVTVGIALFGPGRPAGRNHAPRHDLYRAIGDLEFLARHDRQPALGRLRLREFLGGLSPRNQTDMHFDMAWGRARNIVHAHNGYLDIALTMGLPALAGCPAGLRAGRRSATMHATPLLKTNVLFLARPIPDDADLHAPSTRCSKVFLLPPRPTRSGSSSWLAALGLRLVSRRAVRRGANRLEQIRLNPGHILQPRS